MGISEDCFTSLFHCCRPLEDIHATRQHICSKTVKLRYIQCRRTLFWWSLTLVILDSLCKNNMFRWIRDLVGRIILMWEIIFDQERMTKLSEVIENSRIYNTLDVNPVTRWSLSQYLSIGHEAIMKGRTPWRLFSPNRPFTSGTSDQGRNGNIQQQRGRQRSQCGELFGLLRLISYWRFILENE